MPSVFEKAQCFTESLMVIAPKYCTFVCQKVALPWKKHGRLRVCWMQLFETCLPLNFYSGALVLQLPHKNCVQPTCVPGGPAQVGSTLWGQNLTMHYGPWGLDAHRVSRALVVKFLRNHWDKFAHKEKQACQYVVLDHTWVKYMRACLMRLR